MPREVAQERRQGLGEAQGPATVDEKRKASGSVPEAASPEEQKTTRKIAFMAYALLRAMLKEVRYALLLQCLLAGLGEYLNT